MVWGANAKDNAEPVRVEQAFPAIITKDQFNRVGMLMRSRAPKRFNPRRVGSTYLLSGLVKCKACNRALSGQDAKSGQFSYYACQSNHAPKGGSILRNPSQERWRLQATGHPGLTAETAAPLDA